MKKHIDLLIHSLFVGLIAAVVIIICGWFNMKAWIVFFGWANYFLHGCVFKKSMKMLLALSLGIFIAFVASQVIGYLNTNVSEGAQLYVSAGVIFVVATGLIFLEFIKDWGEVVPATFLGTVLFFASGVSLPTIIPELIIPLVVGIVAGLGTIVGREKLGKMLSK